MSGLFDAIEECAGILWKILPFAALLIVGLTALLAVGGAFNPHASSAALLSDVQAQGQGTQLSQLSQGSAASLASAGKQVVELSWRDGNYFPQEIRVKKGVPVELRVDLNSVRGCMKTIVIPGLGVRKTVSNGDDVISFTASEAGVYPFSCGMGMGTGKIVVEDEAGNVPQKQVGQLAAGSCGGGGGSAGSCGGSCGGGGGCGCGG